MLMRRASMRPWFDAWPIIALHRECVCATSSFASLGMLLGSPGTPKR